jgi:hypothetical protein
VKEEGRSPKCHPFLIKIAKEERGVPRSEKGNTLLFSCFQIIERRGTFPEVKKGIRYFFPVTELVSKHDRLLFSIGPFFPSFGGAGFRRGGIMLSEFLPGWLLTFVYLSRHCVCPI